MTLEALREVRLARPFQPFTLHLADGRAPRVNHPEFLWHTPGGRTVFVATGDESVERVDLLLVVSIETGNGKPRRNGSTKRKR